MFSKAKSDKKSVTLRLSLKPEQEVLRVELEMRQEHLEEHLEELLDEHIEERPKEQMEKPSRDQLKELSLLEPSLDKVQPDVGERFSRTKVMSEAIAVLTEQSSKTIPKGFGIEQWRPKEATTYNRESAIPFLVAATGFTRGGSINSVNSAGQSTDLVRGPNGKAACWQQRGNPDSTQQWYRVPLALCGHLAKP